VFLKEKRERETIDFFQSYVLVRKQMLVKLIIAQSFYNVIFVCFPFFPYSLHFNLFLLNAIRSLFLFIYYLHFLTSEAELTDQEPQD
jgi:hypothetical protein